MRRVLALVAALTLLLAGCRETSNDRTLRCDLQNAPDVLDPQFAQTSGSMTVLMNVFEGLTRLGESGEVLPGCAERYETSQDGKSYIFFLREGLKWQNGEPLTASDFVFAFHRLFDPSAPSPHADAFMSLQNAAEVLSGSLPLSSLGVFAQDDRTVVFTLERTDPALPALLSEAAAMPCSRRFFEEQKGKYGREADSVLGNGAYSVTGWSSSALTLLRNENYHSPAAVERVTLYVGRGDAASLYLEGESDLCLIPYHRMTSELAEQGELFADQSWLLIINPESEVGRVPALRAALLGALDLDALARMLPDTLSAPTGLIPPSATLHGVNYRETAGMPHLRRTGSSESPSKLFFDTLSELGWSKLPRTTLLVGAFSPGPELGGAMQGSWQRELSAHINMEQLSETELLSRVESGRFDLALVPLTASGNHPGDHLELFSGYSLSGLPQTSADGQSGTENAAASDLPAAMTFGDLLNTARQQEELTAQAAACLAAEQWLIDNDAAAALFDAPSLFVQRQGVSGVVCYPASRTFYFAEAVIQN